jgi:hypothetical protein
MIEARGSDLRLSAALAAHLGLQIGAPTLFEIGRVSVERPPAQDIAGETTAAADDYANGHARVAELLEELRATAADTVAAGYRAEPRAAPVGVGATSTTASDGLITDHALHGAPSGGGGLVPLDPRAWP